MTEEKKLSINYFEISDYRILHSVLAEQFEKEGEPIAPFSVIRAHDLDALVKTPKTSFFGFEQYPTLESKAAIIFYTINKKHMLENGNKRMSVLSLLVFLSINGKVLRVSDDELTKKALWLANTTIDTHDFQSVKKDVEEWITRHIADAPLIYPNNYDQN